MAKNYADLATEYEEKAKRFKEDPFKIWILLAILCHTLSGNYERAKKLSRMTKKRIFSFDKSGDYSCLEDKINEQFSKILLDKILDEIQKTLDPATDSKLLDDTKSNIAKILLKDEFMDQPTAALFAEIVMRVAPTFDDMLKIKKHAKKRIITTPKLKEKA